MKRNFGHNHNWMLFDACEIGTGPNDRHVRLPRRRACSKCGVTQILISDISDYPHVQQDMIDYPNKVVGVLA